jgi:hypothetical protein
LVTRAWRAGDTALALPRAASRNRRISLRALRQELPDEDESGAGRLPVSDSPAELAKITPDYLATLDEEQIDQIYGRLTAGPIPDGAFEGRILLPRAAAASSGFPSWSVAFRHRPASQGPGRRG